MGRVLYQATEVAGPISGWVAFDSKDWGTLRSFQVAALCRQGLTIQGHDHYHVADDRGTVVITAWCDDPAQWSGNMWAQVFRMPTLAADARFGGKMNTQIETTVYAEGDTLTAWRATPGEATVLLWADFVPPAGSRRGVMLNDARWEMHLERRAVRGWRTWTEGVAADRIEGGRVVR